MVELYPHQEKVVEKLHNGSILWADVGTGKTITAMAYYMRNYTGYGEDLDIYVITTAKKRDSLDWERDAARYGIGKSSDASVAGVITVDSWNNIGKYVEVTNALFIFDEQRLVGSGSWTKAFLKIAKGNQWILLTATPGDTWIDYIPVFIANGFYKNRTEFLREHVVFSRFSKFPKVERYLGVNKLVRHRNAILVHMEYVRHTTRKTVTIPVEYDKELLNTVMEKRWNPYKQKPLRDVGELFWVMRRVVNSSPTRISAIRSLMEKHPRLIVFYNHDHELMALRDSFASGSTKSQDTENTMEHGWEENRWSTNEPIPTLVGTTSSSPSRSKRSSSASAVSPSSIRPGSTNESGSTTSTTTSGFEIAEWNGHKHEPIPTSDRWLYLVQYQAGAEGWNCVETDAMVFYSLTYSYKMWYQAHGRIDRLNTSFSTLYYYVLKSNSAIDLAIFAALGKKKSFNEKKFVAENYLPTP